MKIITGFKARGFFLSLAFLAGLGLAAHASAQQQTTASFLVDLDTGAATRLGTLGGYWTKAHDINDAGRVAGISSLADGSLHAFITGSGGAGMADLGTLGGSDGRAYGINDAGQVAGSSAVVDRFSPHAFITGPGGAAMRDLGTLGGSGSQARGINAAGRGGVVHRAG